MHHLDDAVRQYLDAKRLYYATGTWRNDRSVLARFLAATGAGSGPVSGLTRELVEDYVRRRLRDRGRKGKTLAPATANVEIRTLKAFAGWLAEEGILEGNPLRRLKQIRVPVQESPRYLSLDQIDQILGALPEQAYPLILTALRTGLRKAELFRLRWDDVDSERLQVRVRAIDPETGGHSKTWRERWVPICPSVLSAIEPTRNGSPWVFPGREGGPRNVRSNSSNTTLRRVAESVGILPAPTLHTLRHSYASHLRMSGVDLETVGVLMGHSSTSTTRIYQHLEPGWLAAEVRRLPLPIHLAGTGPGAYTRGGESDRSSEVTVMANSPVLTTRVPSTIYEMISEIADEKGISRSRAASVLLSISIRSLADLDDEERTGLIDQGMRETRAQGTRD